MKKMAITGGFIFLLGLIIFTITATACDWNFSKLSTRPALEEKSLSMKSSNQSILIEDSNVPISVGLSRDNQIHLQYLENELEYYEIDENDTNITIQKETNYRWFNFVLNFDIQPRNLTLLLPSDFNGSLELKTDNSSMKLDNVTVKELLLQNENGSVKLDEVSVSGDTQVKTSNSSIQISDGNLKGSLQCDNENGSIKLEDFSAENIEAFTKNSSIVAESIVSQGNVVLENRNGKIELDRLRSNGDIHLQNENAGIKGSILGNMNDFSISSKTENAKSNLPDQTTGGKQLLEVFNENGSINIDFTSTSRADND